MWIAGRFAAVLVALATTAVASPPPLVNPPEIVSAGGVLNGTLTVAPGVVDIAGHQITTTVYNGAACRSTRFTCWRRTATRRTSSSRRSS